ncbi:MAG: sulfite exporter TauE/SafE family protein [Alphaproteobacteria bacterium]|nr:sulfite exporter TauE/SafE family protein [Alphaproteobacteria bacterium]
MLGLLFAAGLWAGVQNALAGGGSFVTLPSLMLSGLDARAANIASTLALFPGQATTGWFGRGLVSGAQGLSFRSLALISLVGGLIGAGVLLLTPSDVFGRMVPFLVLFATALFAWGSFGPKRTGAGPRLDRRGAMAAQFAISIYGGYFGGGIGFLMLAALTAAGLSVRPAGATKNVLAAMMNAAAVAVFVFTPHAPWPRIVILGAGAVLGGWLGAQLLRRAPERAIRIFVVVLGVALTVGLFWRAYR